MSWSILSLPLRIYIFLHSIALCLSTQSSSNANILMFSKDVIPFHTYYFKLLGSLFHLWSGENLLIFHDSVKHSAHSNKKELCFFFFSLTLLFSLRKWHHLPLCPHSTLCRRSDWHLQSCQLHKRQSPCYLSWHLRPWEGTWIIS